MHVYQALILRGLQPPVTQADIQPLFSSLPINKAIILAKNQAFTVNIRHVM